MNIFHFKVNFGKNNASKISKICVRFMKYQCLKNY